MIPSRRKWKVGVSPWAGVRPECLSVASSSECDPGTEMNILKSFANLLNVNLDFVNSRTAGCGGPLENGTWTGLMGLLHTGEIDIVGHLCVMNNERIGQNFSNYSYPVILDNQHFLIKVPKSSYSFELGAPFQHSLWVTVVGFWILFLCLHIVALKLYDKLPLGKALNLSMREMLDSITGCDNQNGMIPILWNTYTIYLGFILMLYSTYITAALCRSASMEKPFRNSLEMSEKIFLGDYKVVSFKEKPNPKLKELALEMFEKGISKFGFIFNQLAKSPEEVKDLLDVIHGSTEKLVFTHDKSWINFYLQASINPSDFWLIKDELSENSLYAYFYRKGFELSKDLNDAILLLGDYKYNVQRRKWWSPKNVHEENHIREKSPEKFVISLTLMIRPFVLYFYCVGISMLIVLLEIIFYRCHGKRNSAEQKFI